jgi:hypothetical protein
MNLHDARNRTYGAPRMIPGTDLNDIQDGIVDGWTTTHGRYYHFADDFDGNTIDASRWNTITTVNAVDDSAGGAFGAAQLAPAAGAVARLVSWPLPLAALDFRLAMAVRISPAPAHVNTALTFGLRSGTGADEYFFRATGAGATWNVISGGVALGLPDNYPTGGYAFIEIRREGTNIHFFINGVQTAGGNNGVVFTSRPTVKIEHSRDAGDATASLVYVDMVKLWVKR